MVDISGVVLKIRSISKSKLFFLAALPSLSIVNVATAVDKIHPTLFWNAERSHINHLRSLLIAQPHLDADDTANTAQANNSKCTAALVIAQQDSNSCAKFFYEKTTFRREPIIKGQIRSYLRRFYETDDRLEWRNYFFLASALVRLSDFATAMDVIQAGQKQFIASNVNNSAVLDKLGAYLELLNRLKKQDSRQSRDLWSHLSDKQELAVSDHSSQIVREILASHFVLPSREYLELNHNDAVRVYLFRKWQIDQELDEVHVLMSRLSQPKTDFDVIARTNILAEQLGSDSKEWLAIVKMAARIRNSAELVLRDQGVLTSLDAWIAKHLSEKFNQQMSSDTFAASIDLVSRSSIPLFLSVAKKISGNLEKTNQDPRLVTIVERLRAMQSEMNQYLDALAFDSDFAVVQDLINSYQRIRATSLRLRARLVAFEEHEPIDSERIQQLKSMTLEFRDLQESQFMTLQQMAMRLLGNDPIAQARIRRTARRIEQLKSTVNDLEDIASDSASQSLGQMFSDGKKLLDEMSALISANARKKEADSALFASQLEQLMQLSQQLVEDSELFFKGFGKEINLFVSAVLKQVERKLLAEREKYDLAIVKRKKLLQDEIGLSVRNLEKDRKAREDLRRLQQQNLEWRLSR